MSERYVQMHITKPPWYSYWYCYYFYLYYFFNVIITKRRLDSTSYMSTQSVYLENKLKTLRKANKASEKIRNLQVELNFSLLMDKQNFIDGSRTFSKNDA